MFECENQLKPLVEEDFDDWQTAASSLDENVVCTSNTVNNGACMGDSGGPLVANNTLIGIISWSVGCSRGYPDVHTKIYSHLDWINEKIDNFEES